MSSNGIFSGVGVSCIRFPTVIIPIELFLLFLFQIGVCLFGFALFFSLRLHIDEEHDDVDDDVPTNNNVQENTEKWK